MNHQCMNLALFFLLVILCCAAIDATTPTTSPTYDILLTTESPTIRQPSLRPVTPYPSLQPTDRPATPFPTEMPISDSPSSSKPLSDSPSLQPTGMPNTQQLPTTMEPSEEPISNSPISEEPSELPTSSPVANRQPTMQPSLEPIAGGRSTSSDTEITFNTNMNANDIVHNHLLEPNSTIQIHNVISSYHSCYALYTNAKGTGLNHDSGVILSTGNPIDFSMNDSDETSTNFDIESDESDLASLLPNNDTRVYDPCYIQFDFMCPSSSSSTTTEEEDTTVTFNYMFGSEEYGNLRYHNDIFGAFLNGQNIATVSDEKDGRSIPITISNINSETNSEYYVNNELEGRINDKSPYPVEANGFTNELQASGTVTTGEWNTIKLVIGDVSDGNIDSWALIEAGSFSCDSSSSGSGSWKEDKDVIPRPFRMEMSMAIGFLILFGLLALAIPIVGLLFYNKSCSTSQ